MKRSLILLAVAGALAAFVLMPAQAGGSVYVFDRDAASVKQVRGCLAQLSVGLDDLLELSPVFIDLGADPTTAAKREAIVQLKQGGFVTWTDTAMVDECTAPGAAAALATLGCTLRDAELTVVRRVTPNYIRATCDDGTVLEFRKCSGS